MTKRVALYLRVSTDGQTTENQRSALIEVADRSGWDVVEVYDDDGVSGAKGREYRKEFDRLLKDAARRRFDLVAAWSVDRLGRSLQDLVTFLNELHSLNIDLYLDQQAIDTTTPAGRAMFQMTAVFGEFERAMIVERVKAGLERAKAKGTKSGRPIGRPRVSPKVERAILAKRADGVGIKRTAREVGVGVATVQRVVRENVGSDVTQNDQSIAPA